MPSAITKVLIANRGEIACRIIRTLDKLGIQSVAIYSESDKHALHTQLASEAYYVGPSPAIESYLKIDAILHIAREAKCDAIHPGYGFLSENALFAEACELAGILFIGPSPSAIRAMGSKSAAKLIMEQSKVPLIPGYHGTDQNDSFLFEQAKSIGFPVILKAAMGGGGKGMRIVNAEGEFAPLLESCRREAKSAFNDETILIEKYISNPRHIEVQVFFDQHGNGVHIFDRDCSVQRRHQKIVEEAPAPNIPDTIRERMYRDALLAGHAIEYTGAGTVEFLYDGADKYYFMEMNTRLQVEHPVTEMITGIDLVEWQIAIASGESLPAQQEDIRRHGSSIEVRICAEDCQNNFMPSIGRMREVKLPKTGNRLRLDKGTKPTDDIGVYYDPMIAKLISWGNTRDSAIDSLLTALDEFCIEGIETNSRYLFEIIDSGNFRNCELSTHFLQSNDITSASKTEEKINALAAVAGLLSQQDSAHFNAIHRDTGPGWAINSNQSVSYFLSLDGESAHVTIETVGKKWISQVEYKDVRQQSQIVFGDNQSISAGKSRFWYSTDPTSASVYRRGKRFLVTEAKKDFSEAQSDKNKRHLSPMPGIVSKIYVQPDSTVEAGAPLVAVEAMKMENIIYAIMDGHIASINCKVGDSVTTDLELISII